MNTKHTMHFSHYAVALGFVLPCSGALAADKTPKTPLTHYWMSVETSNQTIPGKNRTYADWPNQQDRRDHQEVPNDSSLIGGSAA